MRDSLIELSADIEPPQGCVTFAGWVLLVIALALSCAWFVSKPRQVSIESRTASQIIRWMEFHAAMQPGQAVTNLEQIYNCGYGEDGYPYDMHLRFRAFGKHAGFEHALSEKYVLFPPGMKVDGKELVFMSAKPFPYRHGMGRIVVFGTGGHLESKEYSEPFLNGWFAASQVAVPPAPVAVRPAAPAEWRYGHEDFWLSVKMTFAKLEWHGFSEWWIRVIEKAVIIAFAIVTGAIVWLCFRRPRIAGVEARAQMSPFLERLSTKDLLAWAAVLNLAVFLFAGCALTGRDRTTDQVIAHLLTPYFMIWEHVAKSGGLLPFLLVFGQFPAYTLVLLLAGKDWRVPVAYGFAVLHFMAVVSSVIISTLPPH